MTNLRNLEKLCKNYAETSSGSNFPFDGGFSEFIQKVNPNYQFYTYSRLIINTLERVCLPVDHPNRIRRLMIFAPPQLGKSELASRLFSSYYLRKFPGKKVAAISYAANIAFGMSKAARRNYVDSGGVLSRESRNVRLWEGVDRSQFWAEGSDGSLTSKGFDLGIIDDPLSGFKDAMSNQIRADLQTWYSTDFESRASKYAAIIVIQTRWHLDDLAGWLLKQEEESETPENWTVLCLEAIKELEPLPLPKSCQLIPDWRAAGESVCPERYPITEYGKRRSKMSEFWWNALYQQRPVAESGSIFDMSCFRFYDVLPQGLYNIVISVDASFKETIDGSFVAIRVWGRHDVLGFVLIDSFLKRMGLSDTFTSISEMLVKWKHLGYIRIIVEEKANGSAIIERYRKTLGDLRVIAYNPGTNSKAARARSVEPLFRLGRVWFPGNSNWVEDSINRYLSFPLGTADDDIDADSQALITLSDNVSAAEQLRGYCDSDPDDDDLAFSLI